MRATHRGFLLLLTLVVAPVFGAAADTGYRVKINPWGAVTAASDWMIVDQINRPDPETMCRSLNAVQLVVPLNQATQALEQAVAKKENIDSVEIDFQRPNRPYVRLELKAVTVTNTRTLDGSRQRLTLRYGSCAVKEKKSS